MKWFIFLFLSLIFILSPYQKGLYFDKDFYNIHILIDGLLIILLIRLFIRKEFNQLKQVWFIIFIPLIYLLTVIWAENPLGAWHTALRWISYVSFFLLLYWSACRAVKVQKLLPIVFQITGIWIALHMLLNQFQLLSYPNVFIMERFAGVFQYPNTFGMIMVVCYLFSLIMLLDEHSSLFSKLFYSFPLVIFFTCFIESYSRGMYIVAPIAWFIGLVLLKPSRQLTYVIYTLFTGISGLALSKLIHTSGSMAGLFLIILFSILTVLLVIFIDRWLFAKYLDKLRSMLDQKSIFKMVLPAMIAIFSFLIVLDINYQGFVYQQLPENIQARVTDMGESSTARERQLFMQDGLKMSSDALVMGHGGNAWETLYRKYQQVPYRSKLAHNGYLEIILDVGWAGFLMICSMLGIIYVYIFTNFLRVKNKIPSIAVLVSTMAIFMHSFIDFNMAFGTVWLMLFWLFVMGIFPGASEGLESKATRQTIKYTQLGLTVFFLIVLGGIVLSSRFMIAEQSYLQAGKTDSLLEKEMNLNKAVSYNPYHDKYLSSLANTKIRLLKEGDNTEIRKEEVAGISEHLAGLGPNNSMILSNAGLYEERIGEKEQALTYYQKALTVDSFDINIYEKVLALIIDLAVERKKENIDYPLERDAKTVIEIYEQLAVNYQDLLNNPIGSAHNSRKFHISESSIRSAAIGYYFLNETDKILELTGILSDDSLIKDELFALVILSYNQTGEQEKSQQLLGDHTHYKSNIEKLMLKISKELGF